MHGIMLHHFHSTEHPYRRGALSAQDFETVLDYLLERWEIVSPQEFSNLIGSNESKGPVVMLTFDDALKSQFDVALPALRSRGIKAGFAIYSSIYRGDPDPLEIFAAFREVHFSAPGDFWNVFSEAVALRYDDYRFKAEVGVNGGFLRDFPFYSREERLFRFVRDEILSVTQYQAVMWELIEKEESFDVDKVAQKLWMSEDELGELVSEGHSIGLHSHTHPTRMDLLSRKDQLREYSENFAWIRENLGVTPEFVAHPCGRYSQDTLEVMKILGVRFGFRSSISAPPVYSPYEIPREDVSNLIRDLALLPERNRGSK